MEDQARSSVSVAPKVLAIQRRAFQLQRLSSSHGAHIEERALARLSKLRCRQLQVARPSSACCHFQLRRSFEALSWLDEGLRPDLPRMQASLETCVSIFRW